MKKITSAILVSLVLLASSGAFAMTGHNDVDDIYANGKHDGR